MKGIVLHTNKHINLKKKGVAIGILALLLFSCLLSKKTALISKEFSLPEMVYETENQITKERIALGKKLFFDPVFSIDSSISCASCHKPKYAFSDTVKFSPGVFNRPGIRNTPSLMNIGFHPYFLREGSVPTIEMQALIPIQEKNEFAHNIVEISKKIQKVPEYVTMSKVAYDREPDHYVITRALGVFQRTLISKSSKFDSYMDGKVKLTKSEKNGMAIFFGEKGNCSSCHGGFNFTSYKLTNNGLNENYEDVGRMRATKDSADLSIFKTPSLRNIEVTSPYMHDGSMVSLEEVVSHYNSGGKNHVNKDSLIKPLHLSNSEKADLVLFLKTLTDEAFVEN